LKCSSLIVSFEHFLLSLGDADLAHFVLLLKIYDQFVLPLDDGLVLFNHFLGLFTLARVFGVHIGTHVIECADLLVEVSDLVVLHYHQLIQFINFFLSVARLSLVTLKHREQTIHAIIAGLSQVTYNLLAHLNLLLVLFELSCDLLRVTHQATDVFFLG